MSLLPVNHSDITYVSISTLFAQVILADFCGIGPRIERRLNAIGIYTPHDLTQATHYSLIAEFDHHWGTKLYLMGQGIDRSPVITQGELPPEKSFGHSYTLPRTHADWPNACKVLSRLSDQVGRRMRQAGFLGRTLWAYVGFEEHGGLGGNETYLAPFNDGQEIFKRSVTILAGNTRRVKGSHTLYARNGRVEEARIRRIGVGMTKLQPMPQTQSLFPEDQRREAIVPTIDRIQDRYGSWSIVRASSLGALGILEDIPDGRSKRPAIL